jgi:hypothetical protein
MEGNSRISPVLQLVQLNPGTTLCAALASVRASGELSLVLQETEVSKGR